MSYNRHLISFNIDKIIEAIGDKDYTSRRYLEKLVDTSCIWGSPEGLTATDQAGNAYALYNWANDYATGSGEWMFLTELFLTWCRFSREAGDNSMFEVDNDICTVSEMKDLYSKTASFAAKMTKRGMKTLFESDVTEYLRKALREEASKTIAC